MRYPDKGTMDVNLYDTKKLLELPEEDFYRYEEFSRELELLMNREQHYYNDLFYAYDVISGKKPGIARLQKKTYRDFISKYGSFLEYFYQSVGTYGPWTRDKVYDFLKENYENKDKILDKINKLLELGIYHFTYIFKGNLSDIELIKYQTDNETVDIITDGSISYGPMLPRWGLRKYDTYPLSVEGAKYIIECEKYKLFNDDTVITLDMVVKDLRFDFTTLPTYEELHDFDIKPYIDYEEVERSTELKKQKDGFVRQILYIDGTLKVAEDFMSRLNHLAEGFNDIPGEISEEKIQTIKELCAEVEAFKDAIIAESVNKELMTEEEIKTEVKVKKKERDSYDYCCCC